MILDPDKSAAAAANNASTTSWAVPRRDDFSKFGRKSSVASRVDDTVMSSSYKEAAASNVSLMKSINLVKDFDEDRVLGGMHTVPSGCSDALAGGGRSDCGARLRWIPLWAGK